MTDDLTKLPEGWKPDTFTHTPGPWEVGQPRTIFPAGNRSLAVAVTERSRREHEANARLIAAAPDLLEALKGMLDHFGVLEDNPFLNKKAIAASKAARAAIAKAEGRS